MKKTFLLFILVLTLCILATAFAKEQQLITRAEFVKEILVESGIEIPEVSEATFSDVNEPELIPYIEKAYAEGIVSGYGDWFGPDELITKSEAIKIIVSVFGENAGLIKFIKESADDFEFMNFTDNGEIAPWAKPYIAYALDTGLIEEAGDALYPEGTLTLEQAKDMIATSKDTYQRFFTRNGLSATDMLVLVNEKLAELDTYKQRGTLHNNVTFRFKDPALGDVEEIENLGVPPEGMDMDITIEASVQNPDKIYMKQRIVLKFDALEIGQRVEQQIETFIDGPSMYTKMEGVDKWILQDIGPFMESIMSLTNQEPYQRAQLSEMELEVFKKFARYEDDAIIDNDSFYVLSLDIDRETYRELYTELMEKVLDAMVALQGENPLLAEDSDFDPETYKQMLFAFMSNMEVEVSYKYFVNIESQMYERVWMSQSIFMPADQSVMETMTPLDEDVPDFYFEMLNYIEGEMEIYDFSEEITFPIITEDNLIKQADLMQGDIAPSELEIPFAN